MGALVKSFVHLLVLNVDSAITGQLKYAPRPDVEGKFVDEEFK
jgi:hypothetical protein